ncbi:hypothetical protein [Mycobacterium paraintracellulare]|uniref:hypothetical protein n=1 Tax=Mycobacterium paraintracellulare TaxID=1138383 RepID=UPI0019266306|nr:hypothetical protein [Mycobacterium paraintracellulare]BCP14131.1 hypothetical protein MINTM021_10400 [Mycobacterium paraintracellulare]
MPLPEIPQDTLNLSVIGSPMFIASQPNLVIARGTAGVVGSFPRLNDRPGEAIGDWLSWITHSLGQHRHNVTTRGNCPYKREEQAWQSMLILPTGN